MTAAVPGWVYMRSSEREDVPRLKWSAFEDNMSKVIEAGGGFEGCATSEVVQRLRELCETSLERWTEKDSVILEMASPSIVFSCEVRSDVTFVQWRLEHSPTGGLKCQPGPRADMIKTEPAFVFGKKGDLESIEFWGRNGKRQAVNTANCRRKLQLTLKRNLATASVSAVDRMPRLKSDPQDYVMANRICFEYDVTSEWSKMR